MGPCPWPQLWASGVCCAVWVSLVETACNVQVVRCPLLADCGSGSIGTQPICAFASPTATLSCCKTQNYDIINRMPVLLKAYLVPGSCLPCSLSCGFQQEELSTTFSTKRILCGEVWYADGQCHASQTKCAVVELCESLVQAVQSSLGWKACWLV